MVSGYTPPNAGAPGLHRRANNQGRRHSYNGNPKNGTNRP